MARKFEKLTKAGLARLAPEQSITEQGIKAERLRSGDLRYSINVMVDGERIHRVAGLESDGVTRTQAEQMIETLRTRAREMRLDLPTARKIPMRFDEAAATYIQNLRSQGGKTIDRKERILEKSLRPHFGARSIAKLTPSDFDIYRQKRKLANVSDATVNRELAVMSHLFNVALEQGWIKTKPKIPFVKENGGRITYLTAEQCGRVIMAAKNDVSPHIYPFCVIALSTSMRMSEILSIQVKHIDFEKRRIYVPKAKAGHRDQPITAALASFLRHRIDTLPTDCPWLFPNPKSSSGRLMTVRKAHRRVVLAAGLNPDEVVRHTFRHTAITHLVQSGVDLPTVQKVSGHKTLAMVARYAHANGTHIDSAMDHLETRLSLPF